MGEEKENGFVVFVEKLRENYKKRLARKTGWGKNEVYLEFEQALGDAAIATADLLGIPYDNNA